MKFRIVRRQFLITENPDGRLILQFPTIKQAFIYHKSGFVDENYTGQVALTKNAVLGLHVNESVGFE